MGYIPKGAKWYLADIVQQITVEGDPRNVVHKNLVLIRADSPEEAYEKAMDLGVAGEASWENIDGNRVTFRFRISPPPVDFANSAMKLGSYLLLFASAFAYLAGSE